MNYFTTKQTAGLLGYNDESYIRKLILSGKLNAKKIGTQWLISEEAASQYKVKSNIKIRYRVLFSLNQELRSLADKILDKPQNAVGPKDAFSTFAIGKGYKTHAAILSLAGQGFGEDAAILCRTLFDLLINLLYILNDKTDDRAYRYFRYDWVLMKKMFNYILTKSEIMKKVKERINTPKPNDATIEDIETNYKLVMQKYNYKDSGWSDKSLFDMAKEVGRIDAYNTIYRLQCQLDHNASRSMNEYTKQSENGITYNIGQSENWVEESLVIAFDFYYHILIAFDSHFKTGFDTKLLEVENRYVTELSAINEK